MNLSFNRQFWLTPIEYSHSDRRLLAAMLVFAMGLHLTLVWQSDSVNLWSASCLFWMAATAMLWRHRDGIICQSSPAAIAVGGFTLTWILFKSLNVYGAADIFLRLSPVISLWAWSALVLGWQRNPFCNRALCMLAFLAMPWGLLYLLDITQMTATAAGAVLRLLGVTVQQHGLALTLPHAELEVYWGCSGAKAIAQLLGFTWIYLCWVSRRAWVRLLAIGVAVGLGFGINVLRVALMAVLADGAQYDWLAYWHLGDGSLLFPLVASAVYGVFLWLLHRVTADPVRRSWLV